MPLRNGKLKRPCSKCNRLFIPSSKTNKLCNKCHKNANIERWVKLSKKVNKTK